MDMLQIGALVTHKTKGAFGGAEGVIHTFSSL